MLLSKLLSHLVSYSVSKNVDDVEILYLSQNSKDIKANTLFFCIKGESFDGHQFAKEVIEKGAVALVATEAIEGISPNIPVIYVKDIARTLAIFSNVFYQFPSTRLQMIGVTGTNGKTTVTHLIDYIFEQEHHITGLFGTIYRKIGDKRIETKNTTPDSLTLQKSFAELENIGGKTCIMEVSSHALALGRVWGVDFDCAVFTNLTYEHMDLHKTMDHYAMTKGLLFAQLGHSLKNNRLRKAIINCDDERFNQYQMMSSAEVISYGLSNTADFFAKDIVYQATKTIFTLVAFGREYLVQLPMMGQFNVYNALASLAVCFTYGIPLEKSIAHLKHFPGVAGRMQMINEQQKFQVIVDFAHTPDGLQNVLDTLNDTKQGKIWTVIGHSGGNRDSSMRPELGRIALEGSDFVVFTADNPRDELLTQIYKGLTSGSSKRNYTCIDDRKTAIHYALSHAEESDIVLLAGKGAEPYQVIGKEYLPYNEVEITKELLKNIVQRKEV